MTGHIRACFSIIAAFALACAMSTTAQAQDSENPAEFCSGISALAEEIMQGRQSGVPMSRMIEVAAGNELVTSLVVAAYEQPRFSTDRVKQETINDFRDETYLACFTATN